MAHPRTNVLIYTEYADSQAAAALALRAARGIDGDILTIGGEDPDEVRAATAQRFAESGGLILISTDSLAEGLNLHRHCFHLIHLDLPYNPNRLEQRNGRIDRYGQRHEPEIRYLYLPGTFEEPLLLHLISKYEKARSALDVMPDTLGLTAERDDYAVPLVRGLSEDPDDLFRSRLDAIRALDGAVEDSRPEQVAALLREIDRAFESFDLMAVCHGWHGMRGADLALDQVASRPPAVLSGDLADFAGAVIAAETGHPAMTGSELRLPRTWTAGLDGLPGFDGELFHVTRDIDTYRGPAGQSTGFLGRAHPLVLRAIRHGCRLPGEAAVCQADGLRLLLTYEMEIPVAHRVVFRRIIAVTVSPDRPPIQVTGWLGAGEPVASGGGIWDRHFASWGDAARADAAVLASEIMAREHAAFVERYAASRDAETARWRRWLRAKANILCGAFVSSTGDLFGAPAAGPAWRLLEDPRGRLVSFATDPDTPPARRRDANAVLEIFQAADTRDAMPGSFVSRPLGMLMMVPGDVF